MAYSKKDVTTNEKNIFDKKIILSGYKDDGYYDNLIKIPVIYDEDLLILLKTIASFTGDKSILDVGANIGYISCVLAKLFPSKQIHAFEPVLSNVQILEKNIDDNRLTNINVHKYGLSSKEEQGSASWEPENRGSAFITSNEKHEIYHEHENVELKVLDKEREKLNIKDCGLIKVDIEGFELEFLHGARNFINEFRPTVVMEANHWCLNALQRVSLPDFLDELFETFPYIHGFWGNKIIDVKEHTEVYMHQNIVENRYMNLLCSFDKDLHQKILEKYKKDAARLDYEESLPVNVVNDLRKEIADKDLYEKNLRNVVNDIETQLEIAHSQQRDVRFLAKRLAKELQLRINKRASLKKTSDTLVYSESEDIKQKLKERPNNREELIRFIHNQDVNNIRKTRRNGKAKAYLKLALWKATATVVNLFVVISRKIAGLN